MRTPEDLLEEVVHGKELARRGRIQTEKESKNILEGRHVEMPGSRVGTAEPGDPLLGVCDSGEEEKQMRCGLWNQLKGVRTFPKEMEGRDGFPHGVFLIKDLRTGCMCPPSPLIR